MTTPERFTLRSRCPKCNTPVNAQIGSRQTRALLRYDASDDTLTVKCARCRAAWVAAPHDAEPEKEGAK